MQCNNVSKSFQTEYFLRIDVIADSSIATGVEDALSEQVIEDYDCRR